ncbi:MAG TPA: bifunctional UDP-N-acetylglucosamine diphosphorylase/glucosamine-1-phosphate N-acetyltransferase GlmU [Terriglobia bacterium]|nr:bifunctional UDP-N-acetylglucosamine diphosphorylase/glucosamine-1-phosphate N-acetyltransferase GlmU [Terriglobia bacterium]
MKDSRFSALILAAGKATRFKSDHSKVLHLLAGRPLGEYVLEAALSCHPERAYMVVGHEAARVRETFARPGLEFVTQREQRGTGDAVIAAQTQIEACPSPALVVLVGDAPLLGPETLCGLVEFHAECGASATILTTRLEKPGGYGRILRSAGARVRAIVEEKDCTPAEKKIREISSGIICFSRPELLEHLNDLRDTNAQREFLLTDMVRIFNRRRLKVMAFPVANSREVLGVNDRVELAQVEKIIRKQKAEALMRAGVSIVDPETTVIDDPVEVGRDTRIEPGVHLLGRTRLGRDCIVQPYCVLRDSVVGDRVTLRCFSVIGGSQVASDAAIGPFAHLRQGAEVGPEARVGNFVEVKNSRIGRGSKSQHLTYLGDATVGERVNIGAGTVTCNYDGEKKYPTVIEDGVFVGSGSMLVAPLRIGKASYVAAGSTLTEDVPPESLALGRARQVTKEGWTREHAKVKGQAETTQNERKR